MSLTCCKKSHHTLAPAHAPCLFSIDLHTVWQHLVIVHFLLLLLLSGTLFQMVSGVPHHCHHISLVWRHTCFVHFTKTELFLWLLYICAWLGLVIALLIAFLKKALMCIYKKVVKFINHDCLLILILLYIMLYIVLAYLMLFSALSNAICCIMLLFVLFSSAIDFYKCFLFSCFVLVYWHIVCLFHVLFSIMRSAFNLFVFPNSTFTPFFIWKGYVLSGEIALKNNHCYYIINTVNSSAFSNAVNSIDNNK